MSEAEDLEDVTYGEWIDSSYRIIRQDQDLDIAEYLTSIFYYMCLQNVQQEMGKEKAHKNPDELYKKSKNTFEEEIDGGDNVLELIDEYSDKIGEEDTRFSIIYAFQEQNSGLLGSGNEEETPIHVG